MTEDRGELQRVESRPDRIDGRLGRWRAWLPQSRENLSDGLRRVLGCRVSCDVHEHHTRPLAEKVVVEAVTSRP